MTIQLLQFEPIWHSKVAVVYKSNAERRREEFTSRLQCRILHVDRRFLYKLTAAVDLQ